MRGYAAIGLVRPKNSVNVGHVLRAAGCFDVSLVMVSPKVPRYRGAPTDTNKTYRHTPMVYVDNVRDAVPYDCVPIAVDLIEGAADLRDFKHPERAFYIFGPEDGTLGKDVTKGCRVIQIPTKGCLNLSAAVNIILYDRLAKR
jgi:tRNA(Leu) C34 or U34 (ribose-2'-O)-methylase TrmL